MNITNFRKRFYLSLEAVIYLDILKEINSLYFMLLKNGFMFSSLFYFLTKPLWEISCLILN